MRTSSHTRRPDAGWRDIQTLTGRARDAANAVGGVRFLRSVARLTQTLEGGHS